MMPRKDPITGCQVVTLYEFFAAEARQEGEGRTAGDVYLELIDDIETDIEADRKRMEAHWQERPFELARQMWDRWYDSSLWYDEDEPLPADELHERPLLVVGGARVDYRWSLGDNTVTIEAVVLFASGRLYRVQVSEYESSGSFYEPPDYDYEVQERQVLLLQG